MLVQDRADITLDKDIFYVSGSLNFSNVMVLYNKSLPHLSRCEFIEFDFSQIKKSNSAGLALVIEWLKYAKHNHKTIKLTNLNKDLLVIAKVAAIETLLT